MAMTWIRLAAMASVATLSLAGCPTGDDGDGGGNNTGPKAYAGSWAGTLNCTATQSLDGTPFAPRDSTKSASITFGEDGRPASIAIIGFSGAPDLTATVKEVGDTQTLMQTVGTMPQTYVVTVRSATYSSSAARLTIDITYSSSSGAAISNGTGVQTIEAVVNGSSLTFSSDVDYEVTLTNTGANITFGSGEVVECSGSLAKQ